jgi:hypothetical protein
MLLRLTWSFHLLRYELRNHEGSRFGGDEKSCEILHDNSVHLSDRLHRSFAAEGKRV